MVMASFGTAVFVVIVWVILWLFLYFSKCDRFMRPRYWRCRFFHNLVPHEYWKMAPFGIGGGQDAWCLKCETCDSYYEISESRYRQLTGG